MDSSYGTIILDIEGTVCPISFVKEELFPFFLSEFPARLEGYKFPLSPVDTTEDPILHILGQFPKESRCSSTALVAYIQDLVARDIKDPVLKQLQGFIWEQGYTTGSILAPLFLDAIECFPRWINQGKKIYIYSSGSVKAQILLFANVKAPNGGKLDFNQYISGYFDTTNAGNKTVIGSYERITNEIGVDPATCLFLSDNPLEVKAAIGAGLKSTIIVKPGNYPITQEDESNYGTATDLSIL